MSERNKRGEGYLTVIVRAQCIRANSLYGNLRVWGDHTSRRFKTPNDAVLVLSTREWWS